MIWSKYFEQFNTHQGGRPIVFDDDMKSAFLECLSTGLSNTEACARVGISRPTLHLHLSRDLEFRDAYRVAKVRSVDALIDKAGDLAERALHAKNGTEVAGIKLAVDHLWRKASRIAPQRWGERSTASVSINNVLNPYETAKRLAFLEALTGISSEAISPASSA